MPKAIWKGQILAESACCEIVDNNRYFPPDSIRREFFRPSDTHTVCHWKGTASYYDVVVAGEINRNAAWCYPQTKPAAKHIEGHIAFWHGVAIED